jgi:PAS domain S-box-containing protein
VHDKQPPPATVTDGLDAARLLRLEHAVADRLADSGTPEEFFEPLLDAIGSALGWPMGAVWTPPEQRPPAAGAPAEAAVKRPGSGDTVEADHPSLRCAVVWHVPDDAVAEFAAESRRLTLPPGIGLPGRVWKTGQPAWVRDAAHEHNLPRAQAAARAGLGAAFCFPLASRDGIEALVEFFFRSPLEPAPELLATMSSLGRRIGDALRRRRIDEAVRRSEARLRAVLEAALDCVVLADVDGVVLEFNPAACRTFGYRREQAIGRELAELIVPPELRARHRAGLRRFVRTGQARALDRRLELDGMRHDGSVFPVELTITRVSVPGRAVFAAYLRDLTERRYADERLRASRRRVIDAVVSERQRLERDLHDGAQQRLVSLGLVLARARGHLPEQPARAAQLLDDAIRALEEAAVELRNLARGIHPSSLTRYGLAGALADLARRSTLDVTLDVPPLGRFPAAIEATAYYVVSEAMTNVARHSGTSNMRVRVEVRAATGGATLAVEVRDDGRGGASIDAGSGLRGLADRVGLLDGELFVASPVGGGTTVRARIPLPPGRW